MYYNEETFNYFKNKYEFLKSSNPYGNFFSYNLNANGSFSLIYCGQKPFGCTFTKNKTCFVIKKKLFKMLDISTLDILYEVSEKKSSPESVFISIQNNYNYFIIITDYLFSKMDEYANLNYIPPYFFDCCDRYMECSDALKCTNPDVIHSKGCNYRAKLEKGIVFFGKNRNKR